MKYRVKCHECGKLVKRQGLGVHRRHAHGYIATEPRLVQQREQRRKESAVTHGVQCKAVSGPEPKAPRVYPPDPQTLKATQPGRQYQLEVCPNCQTPPEQMSNFCSHCGLALDPIRMELARQSQ